MRGVEANPQNTKKGQTMNNANIVTQIVVGKKEATELLKGLKEINIVMLSNKGSVITDTRIAKTKEPIGDFQGLKLQIEHLNRTKNIKPILAKGFTLSLVKGEARVEWLIDKELQVKTTRNENLFTEQFAGEKPHSLEFSKEDFNYLKKIAKNPLDFQDRVSFIENEEGGVRVFSYGDDYYRVEEAWESVLETSKISSGTKVSIKLRYLVEMLEDKDEKILHYNYDAESKEIITPLQAGNDYAMSYFGIEYKGKLESNWTPRNEQEEAEWQQTKAELKEQKENVSQYWLEKNKQEKFLKEKEKIDCLTIYVALHNVVGQATYYNPYNEFALNASEEEKADKIQELKMKIKWFFKKYRWDEEINHLARWEEYEKYYELSDCLSYEDNARLMYYLECLDECRICETKRISKEITSAKTGSTKLGLESFGIEGEIEGTTLDTDEKQMVLDFSLTYSINGNTKTIVPTKENLIEVQGFLDKELLYCDDHNDLLKCVADFLIAQEGIDRVLQLEYSYEILNDLTEDYNEGECNLDRAIDREHDNLHIDYGYADLRVYSLTNEDLEKIDWDLLYSYQNDFESEIRNLLYDKEFLGKYAGKIGIYSRKQKDIFVYERWEYIEETKDIDKIIARHYVPKEILQKVADKIKEIATMYVKYSLENAEEENEQ